MVHICHEQILIWVKNMVFIYHLLKHHNWWFLAVGRVEHPMLEMSLVIVNIGVQMGLIEQVIEFKLLCCIQKTKLVQTL